MILNYCLCCDEDVPCNYVERHERTELTCAYCGFVLDVQKPWEADKASEGYALVAEDSQFLQNIIVNALKSRMFSNNISAFNNGLELITAYSKLIAEKAAIDMAIIDLNMPIMDGLTAARTIRSIEKQHNLQSVPIIFFSSVKADNSLKSQMELLAPAGYMNKGSDSHPERLAERVEQLVCYLMEKYKGR